MDKPAGLLSVSTSPDAKGEDTAVARVLDYARHLRPHKPFAGPVHRLDRDTSGALAVALDPTTRRELRALFADHRIERKYAAIVAGSPRTDQGTVDAPIHDVYKGGKRRIARPGEPAREAVTRFVVVERFPAAALLEVTLETGRQHQIRVHLAHLGLPILGDTVYGPETARGPGAPRQMLHARVLAFEHPRTAASIRVDAPLPDDFRAVLARLKRPATGRRVR